MIVGNQEEWTVANRSCSDHPFHIHQNHFLVTKINNIPLSQPEWHDTIIVPGSILNPTGPDLPQPNINDNAIGAITFGFMSRWTRRSLPLSAVWDRLGLLLRIAGLMAYPNFPP
jgi:FtsP/CotA-like multicopper oxidase with cupredoxin domain